jgi:hypothetical protein
MAERKRIALIYSYNKNWIAGSYYILNLICALKTLSDNRRPIIVILCTSIRDYNFVENYTKYPYLEYKFFNRLNLLKRIVNKFYRMFFLRNYFSIYIHNINASFVFPVFSCNTIHTDIQSLAWIPDFQEKYLPHLFAKKEIKIRNYNYQEFIKSNIPIIFSSKKSQEDFYRFYPAGKICLTFVLPFAVTLPDFSNLLY